MKQALDPTSWRKPRQVWVGTTGINTPTRFQGIAFWFVALLLVTLTQVVAAPAHSAVVTIPGIVYDHNGAPMPAITVTVTHLSDGHMDTITTDEDGAYAFESNTGETVEVFVNAYQYPFTDQPVALAIVDASTRADYVEGILTPTEPTIVGTNGNDIINGTSGIDVIFAGSGDDTINGLTDNDIIIGGPGDDTINGLTGDDIIIGGAGDDTVDGGNQNDTINGSEGADRLIGNAGNDTVIDYNHDTARNRLDGGAGTDTVRMSGNSGAMNTLVGGTGNDTIYAPAETVVTAGSGSDTITIVAGSVVNVDCGTGTDGVYADVFPRPGDVYVSCERSLTIN